MATKTNTCWYETWEEDKKEFCNFCQDRMECLLRTVPHSVHCVRAWHAWQNAIQGMKEC